MTSIVRRSLPLLLIFSIALAARLTYWAVPAVQFTTHDKCLVGDSPVLGGVVQNRDVLTYVAIARSLASGTGYRFESEFTMFVGPGYPLFLAGLLLLLGENFQGVFLVQCLLEALSALMLVLISRRLFGSDTIGVLAGLAYAFYYPNFLYTFWAMTEPLFTVLLVLFFLVSFAAFEKRSPVSVAIAGAVFGAVCLVRPAPVYFLPFLMGAAYLLGDHVRRRFSLAGFLLVGFLAVQGPWLIQGPLHHGKLIIGSTGGGQVLLAGVSLEEDGNWTVSTTDENPDSPLARIIHSDLTQFEKDRESKRLAREELRRNLRERPADALLLMGKQVSRLYLNLPFKGSSLQSYAVGLLNAVLLTLAAVGVWMQRRNRGILFLAAFFIYFTVMHTVVCSRVRLSAPLMPLVLFLAAITVERVARFVLSSWKTRSRSRAGRAAC